MSGATFGRKQTADGAAMDARRAAFIAAERARKQQMGESSEFEAPRATSAAMPVYVQQKSLGTAYLIWFFLGGIGAHRFYLGHSTSGIVQALLTPIGYALLISGTMAGIAFTACGALWILGDAFLMPSMLRACNEKLRKRAVGSVFA